MHLPHMNSETASCNPHFPSWLLVLITVFVAEHSTASLQAPSRSTSSKVSRRLYTVPATANATFDDMHIRISAAMTSFRYEQVRYLNVSGLLSGMDLRLTNRNEAISKEAVLELVVSTDVMT